MRRWCRWWKEKLKSVKFNEDTTSAVIRLLHKTLQIKSNRFQSQAEMNTSYVKSNKFITLLFSCPHSMRFSIMLPTQYSSHAFFVLFYIFHSSIFFFLYYSSWMFTKLWEIKCEWHITDDFNAEKPSDQRKSGSGRAAYSESKCVSLKLFERKNECKIKMKNRN